MRLRSLSVSGLGRQRPGLLAAGSLGAPACAEKGLTGGLWCWRDSATEQRQNNSRFPPRAPRAEGSGLQTGTVSHPRPGRVFNSRIAGL